MAARALAQGPWALLHSAEMMRALLLDCHGALAETSAEALTSQLYGEYTTRIPRPTHNRPLPLPDALLQGAPKIDMDAPDVSWLKHVAEGPWLWELQWATLALLFVSRPFRTQLQACCPKHVAEKWLKPFEERMYQKMLGQSTTNDSLEATAALTPLMTVTTELILLRMTYECR